MLLLLESAKIELCAKGELLGANLTSTKEVASLTVHCIGVPGLAQNIVTALLPIIIFTCPLLRWSVIWQVLPSVGQL
ncbi:MAG TPA: hypothetical protein VKV05_01605 [Terriglobales bacterium]|nr:hypothetical protein [Terriglobales bacterium]